MMNSKKYTKPITELSSDITQNIDTAPPADTAPSEGKPGYIDITQNIDTAPPEDMVKLIHQSDLEVFQGWDGSKGILCDKLLGALEHIKEVVIEILKRPEDSSIILSGCGTSGRIGFMIARTFNERLGHETSHAPSLYNYLIAGGDIALLTSAEASEDKALSGIEDLKQACVGKKKVLLIGITCGLSAAYVAGQLDYAMDHLDTFVPVLLGFNPIYLAKDLPIENWDKTFLQVAQRLQKISEQEAAFILNPIIGPEPITGSSRMKDGSATKIILEALFTAAHETLFHKSTVPMETVIRSYQLVQDVVYRPAEDIGNLIALAGKCLVSEGHLYYVGYGSLGIVGLVDASECVPTFGVEFKDARGFLEGGFKCLNNKEGKLNEMSTSLEYFNQNIVPALTDKDIIILLCTDVIPSCPKPLLESSAVKVVLQFMTSDQPMMRDRPSQDENFAQVHQVCIPSKRLCETTSPGMYGRSQQLYAEIACKWIVNIISTCAHILKGKVYHNYMVDVKVGNAKLFHRAVSIIEQFTRVSEREALTALLCVIYRCDSLTESQVAAPVSQHLAFAANRSKIVPMAMVLAFLKCSFAQAQDTLQQNPLVRNIMEKILHSSDGPSG